MKCNFSTATKKTRGWASYAIERMQWMHRARSFHISAGGKEREDWASDRRVLSLCRSCCPSFSFWSWQQREPKPSFWQLWYSREWNGARTGWVQQKTGLENCSVRSCSVFLLSYHSQQLHFSCASTLFSFALVSWIIHFDLHSDAAWLYN